MKIYDAIIIGGGPAGLNAAVVLGRCRRNVLLFDAGQYRNRFSHGIHNYLTRDDILPGDFITQCHTEIKKYGVELRKLSAKTASKTKTGIFLITDENNNSFYSKKLLIATGLRDNIPNITGIEKFYGRSIFHCPYCDGWEVRDKQIGVYGKKKNGFDLSVSLKTWSSDVTLYTDGRNYLNATQKEILKRKKILVVSQKIKMISGKNGMMSDLIFSNGESKKCEALFFVNGYEQQCNIAKDLGCILTSKGVVITNRKQQANVPGLYVAGDVARDMHFVVVAAAEGAKAGVSINKELQKEEILKK